MLAIQIAGRDCMSNRERVISEVNRIPLQAEDFASPQSVKRTEHDNQFQLRALRSGKQLVHLVAVVEAADEAILLGTVDFIRWIGCNQIGLDGILERLVDDGMVVDDRVCVDALKLLRVKILDVLCFQGAERSWVFLEVRDDGASRQLAIG